MGKRRGELTPPIAADKLEIHEDTCRRWVREALEGAGRRFLPDEVRRDVAGRYFIRRNAIERLLNGSGMANFL